MMTDVANLQMSHAHSSIAFNHKLVLFFLTKVSETRVLLLDSVCSDSCGETGWWP